jgi:hypothetical protein
MTILTCRHALKFAIEELGGVASDVLISNL